jgi:hypothetical protein
MHVCWWIGMLTGTFPGKTIGMPSKKINPLIHQTSRQTKPEQYNIYKSNKFLYSLSEKKFRIFRDSIALKTQDTLFTRHNGRVDIHPFKGNAANVKTGKKNAPPMVFTDKKGYVNLRLPNTKIHRYVIRFYESDGKLAFEIQSPKDDWLILEKSNFIHGGAFDYEVILDGNIHEKGRIFLKS